ncbi:hypothetical protein MJG53_002320 [Ovis ammon polii x Ovis aries]|uniref:Uncharacterized protein n=1 Tax=Ovis ammon polii x Ovis aries TaxID=2918886 RepID=A0ACB9VMN1_9CETA|nr:hypothetical protein MJG53_002320 [Ovis ammon polii x Ovis aries]
MNINCRICRRGDQARPPKSVHRKRCRARAELLFEHPPSQSHRLSSLVAGNGWSPERRGECVSHRPMAVFTVQLQAEEPMNILAESGLRTRNLQTWRSGTTSQECSQETVPRTGRTSSHPPSQSHRLSSLVARNGWSPERRGERVSHRPMAVFTVQLQAEEPMNILAESGLRTRAGPWESGMAKESQARCKISPRSLRTLTPTGRSPERRADRSPTLEAQGSYCTVSNGLRICRRGDQARPPKSVHRNRCRARAELPCEHPPSQTHRLSSLVAGNGWSQERRGERVSHRPMDRDDAGLRLPDSKDPGERRRFTSSYGKNADSAEWTAAWAAREKPEKTF